MSKIEKRQSELLIGKTPQEKTYHIERYSRLRNVNLEEATSRILEIEKELKKLTTIERIEELRRELNPAGIGVIDGEVVMKRKYVRKTQRVIEEVQLDVVEDIKIPGIFKIGDTVKIIGNSNVSCNHVGEIGVVIEEIDKSPRNQTVRVRVGNRTSSSNNTRINEIEHYIERIKTKEELETERLEKIAEEERAGCFIPSGTEINTNPKGQESKNNYYIVSKITKEGVYLTQKVSGIVPTRPTYPVKTFNNYLNSRTYTVINTTPEIEARIGVFNNIVSHNNFINESKSASISRIQISSNGSTTNIMVTAGFTGNCQLSIVGNMVTLMKVTSDLKKQLKEIQNYSGRKLLLCDIRSEVLPQLQKELPKNVFKMVSPYKSSNGSNMVIVILNISLL